MSNIEANYEPGIPKERYTSLGTYRSAYLTRAQTYAKVSLPYIMPEVDDQSAQEVQLDFSSVGAMLVNHLANRYVQELFPVNRSFFQLQIDESERSETVQEDTELDTLLTAAERRARWAFEQRHARPSMLDLMKHCVITGNGLIYYPPKTGKLQLYALDEYVMYRDAAGNIIEIVTEDKKGILSLDPDIRQLVMDELKLDANSDLTKEQASLYTYIRVDPEDPETFLVTQSIESLEVPDSFQSYPKAYLPWLPQVWNRTRREIYGRGLIEDHYGSFTALSVLSEALVTGAATMADIKFLVRPGSLLDVNSMNSAPSGTYHYGMPDDVSAIQSNKQADYQFIKLVIDDYVKHLGKAFMHVSSQIRDSERTTAEENRLRAMELDQSHGGVFSNFSMLLQSPVAALLLRDIDLNIEGSSIEPVVVTGLDSMSRNATNEKIRLWIEDLSGLNALPEPVLARLKLSDVAQTFANGRDVDTTNLIKTEEEVAAEQKAAQEQQMQATAGEAMLEKADAEQIADGIQSSQAQGG